MVNGRKLTIFWHVDDIKTSHVDRKMATNTTTWIESIYGEMNGSRGKKHNYLGMWIHFSSKREVNLPTEEYFKKAINKFPE